MKLILAIVQREDAIILTDALMEAEFYVTKLSSTGGFLKMNNTTLMIGTDDCNVEKALEIIKNTSKSREQFVASPMPVGSMDLGLSTMPIKVRLGGATVFIPDVDRFEKY